MKRFALLVLFVVAGMIAGCLPAPASTQDVNQVVEATFQAMTAQAVVETLQIASGSISGTLGYPSEVLPAMRVVAFNALTGEAFFTDNAQNQTSFKIENLVPGSYYVIAYTLGSDSFPKGLAGGYTQYIVCGTQPECTDRSFAPVEVIGGQDTPGIHVGDWILAEGTYPPMPGNEPPMPEASSKGVITGFLSYPSQSVPPLVVVAFRLDGVTGEYYFVMTVQGQSSYELLVPQGQYHIMAYALGNDGLPTGLVGGYTQAVLCGLNVECTDHSLLPVSIVAGESRSDIDPGDWYAPPGTFPTYPLP